MMFPQKERVAFRARQAAADQSFLCAPSQNGGVFESAQLQSATFFFSVMTNDVGCILVPLREPSQNGVFDFPQCTTVAAAGFQIHYDRVFLAHVFILI